MNTTSWILLGVLITMFSIVLTIFISKRKTKSDREEVIESTVERLTYGVA